MAEKLTRKEKIALQKKAGPLAPKQNLKIEKSRRSIKKMLGLIAAIAGFLFYSNTLNHDYVLDDYGLIKDNTQTRQGVSAIPEIFKSSYRYGMNITDYQLYRPLSKAMFALEWSLSPENASLSHWMNVIYFAILCFILFHVLVRYLNGDLLVPFITTLLFAAHPLHTEVVANIKSRDEIISFLLAISSIGLFHKYATAGSKRALAGGLTCFFLALLTKESSITFLAVVPLAYYFFTSADKSKYVNTIAGMAVCTIIFLLIRRKVLGNVETLIPIEDNSLAGIKNIFLQKANAIYLLGVYVLKMIIPTPLMADASYNHFPPVAFTSWKFLVPFAVFIAAAVYAIKTFKSKNPVSFAILFFFITVSLVSNVVILIGTNYGERLMFMPSLSICFIAGIFIAKFLRSDADVP